MIHLYAGHDFREAVGLAVFIQSVLESTSKPVCITPLSAKALAARSGSNAFTWSRFQIPRIQGFKGRAIFMDGVDMICRADLVELEALRDDRYAVQVVKHAYKTKHARKYIGHSMECDNRDYERKQWASMMLINCEHPAWQGADQYETLETLQLRFIDDDEIGELPIEWNWLVDEHGANDSAKLLHWTAGIPAFHHYQQAPMAEQWFSTASRALNLQSDV